MRITQGTFSFLEDLTNEQIEAQLRYALQNGWAIMVEYTDDPHPRNSFWDMWNQPEFDLTPDESDVAMRDIQACRQAYPNHYVKVVCYDSSLGRQTSGWAKWVDASVSLERFGASAPGTEVYERLGFTVDSVVARARDLVEGWATTNRTPSRRADRPALGALTPIAKCALALDSVR